MSAALFGYAIALLMFANSANLPMGWLAITNAVLGFWFVIVSSIQGYQATRR